MSECLERIKQQVDKIVQLIIKAEEENTHSNSPIQCSTQCIIEFSNLDEYESRSLEEHVYKRMNQSDIEPYAFWISISLFGNKLTITHRYALGQPKGK